MKSLTQRILILIVFLSVAALAVALMSQHFAGMRPCAWCVFQRVIVIMIGLSALLGLVAGRICQLAARASSAVVTVLGLGGIVAAWYQYSVAAVQFSCDQTFADRFMTASGLDAAVPWLFGIYATCMDARVDLLGIEYALWALALFIIMAALGLAGVIVPGREPHRSNKSVQ